MIQITDKKLCCGCFGCYNACPVNAISMQDDHEGFLYPAVDLNLCIDCKKCEMVCPCLHTDSMAVDVLEQPDVYAGYNTNQKERTTSSSGGIFVLLAKAVLKQGGIVFGAAFDDTYMVYHTSAKSELELQRLIGSKYVQSRIEYVYKDIKKILASGRRVLFVGTTCQNAGLRTYLGKEYSNLVCVDFICLGIPSPKIWRNYLSTYFSSYKIQKINFKDKSRGWHRFSLRIEGEANTFSKVGSFVEFFCGYFKGLYSRPVCSVCPFKSGQRHSDMTISDCWGSTWIAPELDDNKGLSSIVIHSSRGQKIFDQIKENMVYKNANLDDIKKYNNGYYKSKPMGVQRAAFWVDYDKIPAKQLFKKYCTAEERKVWRRILCAGKTLLRRFLKK